MGRWQWEGFEDVVNSPYCKVTDPGPLTSPINSLNIIRDEKLQLILNTEADYDAKAQKIDIPPGTLWKSTDFIKFSIFDITIGMAKNVVPLSLNRTLSTVGNSYTREKALIHSLELDYRNKNDPKYIIEWIENVNPGKDIWSRSSIHETEEFSKIISFGNDEYQSVISEKKSTERRSHDVITVNVCNTIVHLCKSHNKHDFIKNPGFLIYAATTNTEVRHKIRSIISFCLGYYLIYIGHAVIDGESKLISSTSKTAKIINQRIFDIPPVPPTPLWTRYEREVDEKNLSQMASAIFRKYDELNFGAFSWSYWHALCAPIHIAAAHFGAAIESLQKSYLDNNSEKLNSKIVNDNAEWNKIRQKLELSVTDAEIDDVQKKIFLNKISGLNRLPQNLISEKMFNYLGLEMGKLEIKSWEKRNDAAHGKSPLNEDTIETIKFNKIMQIILCRMMLRMTEASDTYFDYFTLHYPIRKLTEAIPLDSPLTPPPAPGSSAGP